MRFHLALERPEPGHKFSPFFSRARLLPSPPVVTSTAPAARVSRRRFLQQGSAAAAGLVLTVRARAAEGSGSALLPANERIGVGIIGLGAMGSGHLRRLAGDPGVQVVAVCDVDRERREQGRRTVAEMYAAAGRPAACTAYNDFREVLARPDVDAVVIATPDHWHAFQAVEAARAGKDIYCEKPISVTIEEGRRVVEAVRRYGRVFQTGTQYRSMLPIRRGVQFVRTGGLGRVKHVFTQLHTLAGWLNSPRFQPYRAILNPEATGRSYTPLDFALPAEPVPEGLDWELWVGPAPWRPYHRLYHENPSPGVVPWAFSAAFGVTSNTWFLSHAADVIQYALGVEESGPVEIVHPDSGRFPTLTMRYASGTLLHFIQDWPQVKSLYPGLLPDAARVAGMFGGVFVGERGWLSALYQNGPTVTGGPEGLLREMDETTRDVSLGARDHHANWLQCLRTRGTPSCPEELGHRTATLGHLTNLAYWTSRSLRWDPSTETFTDCDAANRLRARLPRPPWRL